MLNRKMLLVCLRSARAWVLTRARGAEKLRKTRSAFWSSPAATITRCKGIQRDVRGDSRCDDRARRRCPRPPRSCKPELADTIDVSCLYDMWVAGFTPEQQQAFVALLNRGIGVVALHHTLGGHQEWPEYAKIIGGKY